MRSSSSQENNTKRQGQDFLVHCLQLQGSPSENLGESPKTGNKGTKQSGNNRETSEKIETDYQDKFAWE